GAGYLAVPSAPCDGAPYRRLDFWVGEWTVTAGGRSAGTNRIVKILGGCAIEEHWLAADGRPGRSLFYYVPGADEWRQVWVTTNPAAPGGVKEKREIARGSETVFQGEVTLADGRRYLDRTVLAAQPDGTVRQRIEISTDGGASWRVTFDGVYTRAPPG
ncbi:MAG TPA: hypothetical protein VMN37_01485, partial [Gemmatimonadales bacterium]|nr:hypothetical protein [Gemmatimonadales bacterium]